MQNRQAEGRSRSIADWVGQELEWIQPRATKRDFELRAGGETIGTMSFRSFFGSFATAQMPEGSWTFKRVGFWKPLVTIRPAGSEDGIAAFANNWTAGGTLELKDGRRYRANTNLWMTSYEFTDEQGEALVRFVNVRGVAHLTGKVEITPAGAKLAETAWLVALGWYLAVKMYDDLGLGAGVAAS